MGDISVQSIVSRFKASFALFSPGDERENRMGSNNDESFIFNDQANSAQVLQEKLADAEIPGAQIEFDPDEAEKVGAFVEDALSEQDAIEASIQVGNSEDEPYSAKD